MDTLEVPSYPPPPPPKRPVRPKITLQIPISPVPMTPRQPSTGASMYYPRFPGKVPGTPGSHISDPHGNPYFNPFVHMYHNKASEFMFKQFEGFKDFTMNTAKSGLSAGEKSAFWFYNRLKLLSRKWFTHLFLSLCLVLYSFVGAAVFVALEAYKKADDCSGLRAEKSYSFSELFGFMAAYIFFCAARIFPLLVYLFLGLVFIAIQSTFCLIFA